MRSIKKTIALSVLVIALTSCSTFAPKATETPIPTETALPTSTSTPKPTSTPTETATQTAAAATATPTAPGLAMPSGTPASAWEGIPIMPKALAGEGDSQGYAFTIKASADEVQKFYEKELKKLGYSLFASGQGTTEAVMLIFMKGADMVTVSIIPQPDGTLYVLLVK